MARSKLLIALLVLALAAILGACGILGGPAPTFTPIVRPTPRPTLTPTPAPTPTPEPTPIPTPTLNLTSGDVQRLVFQVVSPCADQVSLSSEGISVRLTVTAIYSQENERWVAEVTSEDGTLSFGRWQVMDATGAVVPVDEVAGAIASAGVVCAEPPARLATGPTPPLFLPPSPTPLVATAEQAQLRVWVTVFNCYDHFPELTSFTAYGDSSERWLVEGKSGVTHYGLWRVDAITGEITPSDKLAEEVDANCALPAAASFPAVVAGQQAQLLVWLAVYDCFSPRPPSDSFTAYQDNPQRWLVEGREETIVEVEVERVVDGGTETFTEDRTETVFYGLWVVDTSTAVITPWDQLARETVAKTCYQTP